MDSVLTPFYDAGDRWERGFDCWDEVDPKTGEVVEIYTLEHIPQIVDRLRTALAERDKLEAELEEIQQRGGPI